ncbi:GerAB/ArcD/ProY family transporter [Peribacillus kribbensis]|uniref:GerAB/ArcD/ProY family transporter n=1 Tax=Peribacillus kribbensis TaxID=356658 RepID=UPI0004115F76|nr:GerAB/ArcD/ProY family transporter [Peribacillus kribbensis]
MARYFYMIVFLNMTVHIIFNVPLILIQNRFNGAVISMALSIVIGTILSYMFIKAMSKYPYNGLPEIFMDLLPAYIRVPFLIFLSLMWIAAGSLAIGSFAYLIKLYLNPEMDLRIILGFLVLVLLYGSTRGTQSILYKVEITILTVSPFIAYIIFKALTSNYFYPVHIKRALQYSLEMPNYSSVAAASYIFTGYINLVIMNRNIQAKRILKHFWLIPVLGTLILAFTYFIPFGFLGIKSIGDFVLPWMVTVDTIRMEYGFIERASFLLVMIFMQLSILFAIINWNVGLELMKSALGIEDRKTGKRLFTLVFLGIVGFLTVYFQETLNQRSYFEAVKIWFNLRLPVEILLVLALSLLSLRRKQA